MLTVYSVSVPPPVLSQWHVQDPGHSAKSARWQVNVNTHTPLSQRSRSGLTLPLSRHGVGTYRKTSSRATCQGTFGHSRLGYIWTDTVIKRGISVRELIYTSKINLKSQAGNEWSNIFPKSSKARKEAPLPPFTKKRVFCCCCFLANIFFVCVF